MVEVPDAIADDETDAIRDAARATGRVLFIQLRKAHKDLTAKLAQATFLAKFASVDNVDMDTLRALAEAAMEAGKAAAMLGIVTEATKAIDRGEDPKVDFGAIGNPTPAGLPN
jgi:hypothetical protein